MGVLLLDVLCYVNALDDESRATFPEAFASCLLYFLPSPDWKGACDEIMSRLCRYVLPTSLGELDKTRIHICIHTDTHA